MKETLRYRQDNIGFYRVDNIGNKWRPVTINNGRLVFDNPRLDQQRKQSRETSGKIRRSYRI